MSDNYAEIWNKLHKSFIANARVQYDAWLDEFEGIIEAVTTDIIDLGCGVTGNNTFYLLDKGKGVISCDFAEEALKVIAEHEGTKTKLFNMLDKFPFEDNVAEVVIADLSLHYFRKEDTERIISEIKRVLKPNGHLFFRVNSTSSTEYKTLLSSGAEPIEPHLYFANNMEKRFFSLDDIDEFFADWNFIAKREENMTRWSSDKIVWTGVVQVNK